MHISNLNQIAHINCYMVDVLMNTARKAETPREHIVATTVVKQFGWKINLINLQPALKELLGLND